MSSKVIMNKELAAAPSFAIFLPESHNKKIFLALENGSYVIM